MPDPMIDETIEQSQSLTVQARGRGEVDAQGIPLVLYMAIGGNVIPAWWSARRDFAIRNFWKNADHLSSALYTMISKMTAIPFRIVPRNQSNKEWVGEAERYKDKLMYGTEWGDGWVLWYSKFLEDLLGQDNGGFSEVIGAGDPLGPIIGEPITVSHLDAGQVRRTGNPTWPILYTDTDGKLYRLHRSRVMMTAQMPSSISYMYGVGVSAISRCINIAQTLLDIVQFKQEKLGSRPHRFVMITQGGLDPEDVRTAFELSEIEMSTMGLSRYSKGVVIGNQANPDADAKIIELASLPDGFDEQTSTTLGMATIAMAFGVDARELFPSMQSGATRADALLQHLKQRGKGPGQIIQSVEALFRQKYLPPYLKLEFDFQDDAEDRQVAEIRNVRSQARERNLLDASVDIRTSREQMLYDKEITRQQFERMELEDGRLEDGTSSLILFFTDNPLLKFDQLVENPLDTISNDPDYITSQIADLTAGAYQKLDAARNIAQEWEVAKVLSALDALKSLYESQPTKEELGANENGGGKRTTRNDPTRREDLTSPRQATELDHRDSLRPGKDDKSLRPITHVERREFLLDRNK